MTTRRVFFERSCYWKVEKNSEGQIVSRTRRNVEQNPEDFKVPKEIVDNPEEQKYIETFDENQSKFFNSCVRNVFDRIFDSINLKSVFEKLKPSINPFKK